MRTEKAANSDACSHSRVNFEASPRSGRESNGLAMRRQYVVRGNPYRWPDVHLRLRYRLPQPRQTSAPGIRAEADLRARFSFTFSLGPYPGHSLFWSAV